SRSLTVVPVSTVSPFNRTYHGVNLVLLSFPTRRSSDLIGCIPTLKYLHRRAGASRFTALSASERARILGIGRYEYNEAASAVFRSEEHTSELQSREKLVCRLLLEKKNHLLLYTQ